VYVCCILSNLFWGQNKLKKNETMAETAETADLLGYPIGFFPKDGTIPSEEAAALLWCWRRNRTADNAMETESADGAAMVREITDMKRQLKSYAISSYWKTVREGMTKKQLKRRIDDQPCLTRNDVIEYFSNLKQTPENEDSAYQLLHSFQRGQKYQAKIVDDWLHDKNMKLLGRLSQQPKSKRESDRGGFGAHVREAKSQAIKQAQSGMKRKQGWYIATTKSHRSSASEEVLHYDKRTVDLLGKTEIFYVVNVAKKMVQTAHDSDLSTILVSEILRLLS
jgi:hypothetical protein